MMPLLTVICGGLLIVVGIVGYVGQDPDAGKVSITALIPAFVGGLLVVLGILAFSPSKRKHAMHFAAMVGLVGFLGGFMPLYRQWKNTGGVDVTKPSAISGILMILICAVFVWMCVNSFIRARRERKAA